MGPRIPAIIYAIGRSLYAIGRLGGQAGGRPGGRTGGRAGSLGIFVLALVLFSSLPLKAQETAEEQEALVVVTIRCGVCHTRTPLWPGLGLPPRAVVLETWDDLTRHAREILLQTVASRAMPPGNITAMEDEERRLLARVFAKGRKYMGHKDMGHKDMEHKDMEHKGMGGTASTPAAPPAAP